MSIPATQFNRNEVRPIGGNAEVRSFPLSSNLRLLAGSLVRQVTAAAVTMVQRITINGTPTGGTVVLSFEGVRATTTLPHNPSATAIRDHLNTIPALNGNVTVTGTGPFDVTFTNALANLPQELIVMAVNSLTGGSTPNFAITQQTAAVPSGRFIPYDGTGTPAIVRFDVATDRRGQAVYGQVPVPQGQTSDSVPMFISGSFTRGSLIDFGNINAAITAWGARYITGTAAASTAEVRIP